MIKRSTIVVVVLFAVALIALLLIQRNPEVLQTATPTPAATAMARLLPDWSEQDVQEIILNQATGGEIALAKAADGAWSNPVTGLVEPGKVEQLLSELLATRVLVELPADYDLESLQLANPAQSILLRAADGRQTTLLVGGMTPTQSGYYVRIDDGAPVAVSKYAVEAVLELFTQTLPTAEVSPTP